MQKLKKIDYVKIVTQHKKLKVPGYIDIVLFIDIISFDDKLSTIILMN